MRTTLDGKAYARVLLTYGSVFVIALLIAPFIGGTKIPFRDILFMGQSDLSSVHVEIFWYQRVPRVILAACVGGSLALVGACFQVILHNPLAEPYTLGVTGGASVGAVSAILIPGLLISWGPFSTVQLFSLLGAMLALFFLYFVSKQLDGFAIHTLLLAGITISIVSAGLILGFRYVASPNYLMQMDRWLMGGLDVVGYRELSALFPLLLPGLGLLFSCMVEVNHLSLGEELAAGHGVDVASVQRRIFFGGGLTTAAVVSLSGPIGFVGLIIPHAVRGLSGYDQRIVLPGSFLLGGAFLVACDTIARTILSPRELPVGIITALIGGPVFIRILLKRR